MAHIVLTNIRQKFKFKFNLKSSYLLILFIQKLVKTTSRSTMSSEEVDLVKSGKSSRKKLTNFTPWKKCLKQELFPKEVCILWWTKRNSYHICTIRKSKPNFIINHTLCYRFLVNMSYAFDDRENLYLVIDLMQGGDLRYHLAKHKKFSEE